MSGVMQTMIQISLNINNIYTNAATRHGQIAFVKSSDKFVTRVLQASFNTTPVALCQMFTFSCLSVVFLQMKSAVGSIARKKHHRCITGLYWIFPSVM